MSAAARAAVRLLTFYRTAISPALPPTCRYSPSCSAYAVGAIERFGLARGSWLALRRLLRCQPFHAGGHDPVPPRVDPAASALVSTVDATMTRPPTHRRTLSRSPIL